MKCKLFISIIFAALTFSGISVRGQGSAFTYQGILKQEGFAAYGTYDFYFAAYGSLTGGGPVSPSAFANGVVVSNGLFTVTIDLGPSVFNGAPRWLQIGVKTNASLDPWVILAPRQQLTPTPYAVYAGNATSANFVPWSGIQSMPLAFADGIDNDTTYAAGTGLMLSGTTFSLNSAFTDGLYWRLDGNTTVPGQFLGTVNNQPLELRVNNTRALRLEPAGGSPNVIGGSPLNLIETGSGFGAIGGGNRNVISNNSHNATIAGGVGNVVHHNSSFATIGGGSSNRVASIYGTIVGGWSNTVAQIGGFVGGGTTNVASGYLAAVVGGEGNVAGSTASVVGGGFDNEASGYGSTIAGGYFNQSDGNASAVAGGASNVASGDASTIPGGSANRAAGAHSLAAGLRARADHDGTFVWADRTFVDFSSTTSNQFLVRAKGGVGIGTNNPHAQLEVAGSTRSASIEITTGPIRSIGAGIGTSTPVFIHRATAANIDANTTNIDHPLCNNDPNAILIVTPNWNPGGLGSTYLNHPIGVYYNAITLKWAIFNQDIAAMPPNAAFNVLVVKP
ncbi:MAG TPA: hypothetical protein VJ063_14450 [Verrucomicrobiae bacterium]|nr:hypothetical protein [Verrucomicrobiae bacterium]